MSAPYDRPYDDAGDLYGEPYDPNPPLTQNPYTQGTPAPPPYSMYGYPAPYGAMPRPGAAAGAGALGYVVAGLLIAASFVLLLGAAYLNSWDDSLDTSHTGVATELVVGGLLNLVAAGLLIAGGVLLAGRHATGRTLLTWGCGACLVEAVYWVARAPAAGVVFWALVFGALATVTLFLAWSGAVSQWLRQ